MFMDRAIFAPPDSLHRLGVCHRANVLGTS
jgi:hypothetical protein